MQSTTPILRRPPLVKIPPSETRTLEQLREQYEVEKELANKLRAASRTERQKLYSAVYDELFRRVPHHPQRTKRDPGSRDAAVTGQLKLLKRFLNKETVFLEVGGGDCALAIKAAGDVKQSYGLEVSGELVSSSVPHNFRVLLYDGVVIRLPDASVDVAYSFSVIEHIHPDDAADQAKEILRVLKPGGVYVCITPNRLTGPTDISYFFDSVPTGLHLKEYSIGDLAEFFRSIGFRKVWSERVVRDVRFRLPSWPVVLIESCLDLLPFSVRTRIARTKLISNLLYVSVVAQK